MHREELLSGGTSGKEHACRCKRHRQCGFDPWAGKIPWRRAWRPTPVFLPGESHEQMSQATATPMASKSWSGPKRLSMMHALRKNLVIIFQT